ncbi:MAG: hypothetical protein C0483_04265 [Pirellula sp.]|nr:hypothetical protein [Pirellula sp.]
MNTSAKAVIAVRPTPGPRGVILLIMLGLLALFTLIAVTFVVASGQFRRGATAAASAERMGDPFDTLLHQALMQVARGSNHPHSVIGPHSLLEDMYGNGDAVTGCCFIDTQQIGGTVPASLYSQPAGGSPALSVRADRNIKNYKGMPGQAAPPMLIEIGAVSFGWDREPGVALADDNNNGVTDDAAEVPDRASDPLNGDDCFLGATYAHPAMVGEDPTYWPTVWQNKQMSDGSSALPLIDNVENYYAGRVITFVNGDAAGQSAYIVRSKLVPVTFSQTANLAFRTILYIQPFANGAQPSHKDRFVINGRAFNGAGFGYNPYIASTASLLTRKPAYVPSGSTAPNVPNPLLRALDMPYSEPFIRTPANDGAPYTFDMIRSGGYPMALLPNPVDGGYRDYLNRYTSIIDADEDYDAPDEQNMLLSYSVWVPSTNGWDPGRYRTIMPSLHRPDLVKYFTNKPELSVAKPSSITYARWHDVPPYIRRRYIMRPDPSDHYDWTQELNATQPQNSDGWTPGEPFLDTNNNGQWDPVTVVGGAAGPAEQYTDLPNPKQNQMYDIGDRAYYNTGFDAMDGPWDVDNDNDNLPDSIWVDLGAPVTTAPDGKIVKPMFAVLVRDLDGRINVNAHGSAKHYDRTAAAYGPYTPQTKPNPYQSHERLRMGNYAVAMYQYEPDVAWNTVDVIKVHTAGDPDAKRDGMTFRDIPFQGVWALPYYNDGPFFGNNALKATNYIVTVPNSPTFPAFNGNRGGPRPLMFDIRGSANSAGAVDWARQIRGFEPAVGQGWSVADINLAQVLQTGLHGLSTLPNSNATSVTSYASSNYYRFLLEGVPHEKGNSAPAVGRYGESYLVAPSGAGGSFPGLVGPRAGVTDLITMYPNLVAAGTPAVTAVAAMPPVRGDDDIPAAPSRFVAPSNDSRFVRGGAFRNAFMPFILPYKVPTALPTDQPYGVTVPEFGPRVPNSPTTLSYSPSPWGSLHGDFGTPGDADSDGSVALDASGQPVFVKMGTANEEFDDPTEINLHRRYFAQTFFGISNPGAGLSASLNGAGVPYTTDIDAPFAPAEMERLLRARDAGSDTLPSRLRNLLRGDGEGGDIDNYDLRRSLTTESWDVPCPHVAPTPELAAAMRALNLPINNPSISDLLRARFYLASGQAPSTALALKSARLATIAMRSYRWQTAPVEYNQLPTNATADEKAQFPGNYRLTNVARKRWHTRLLSADLGQGLRMDLNVPFGNGFDDNNNGVVDEPYEWTSGGTGNGSIFGALNFDGNRDGNYFPNLDEEPRQQFAKELYCLMMLLIDQNYVELMPLSVSSTSTATGIFNVGLEANLAYTGAATALYPYIPATGNNPVTGISYAQEKLRRWLTARRIAQWAINVVDFRDRDSIMTPFEFDADPFFDNDNDTVNVPSAAAAEGSMAAHLPTCNGTWDVDGYLIPTTMADGFNDTLQPWRGVVWGCEYPDLLLTETAAFHDRRTQNLKSVDGNTNGLTFATTNYLTEIPAPTGTPAPPNDPSWDSYRIPQGTALFELYATGNPNNPALPRELYTLNPSTGDLTLDLTRTVSATTTTAGTQIYPVWRLAITQSHYVGEVPQSLATNMNLSIADRLREYPATCSLDLRDPGMSLLPSSVCTNITAGSEQYVPIERVVTFVQNPTASFNAKAGLTSSKTLANQVGTIDVYYNTTTNTSYAQVLPGDYVVVGPGRDVVAGPRNITCIGKTYPKMVFTSGSTSTTLTNYSYPQSIIDMGDPSVPGRYFLHTSVNGVDEYPIRYLGASTLGNLVRPTTALGSLNILDIPGYLQIRPPVSVPCMATVGSTGTRRVGLNISEPTVSGAGSTYYPAPTKATKDEWLTTLETMDAYTTVYDTPLDEMTQGDSGSHNENIPHSATEEEDRTLLNYKTVFLQRLADPTRGWDQYLNPYLTIDWMPIDLTIYNGEPHYVYKDSANVYQKDITKTTHLIDPSKQKRVTVAKPQYAADVPATAIRYGSRQRGAPRTPFRGNYSYYDLWSQPDWLDTSVEADTRPPLTGRVMDSKLKVLHVGGTSTTLTPAYYNVAALRWQDPFDHTFGYLNLGYHTMRAPTNVNNRASLAMQDPLWVNNAATDLPEAVSRYWLRMSPVREPLRRPFGDAGLNTGWFTAADLGGNTRYVGTPRRPFNWLTWNNRPFAGSMELMLVPASSPGRLLHEYSMRVPTPPSVPDDLAPGAPNPAQPETRLFANRYAPYSGVRAANHYMPRVAAPQATITSGHTTAAPASGSSVYAGNFMAGFISKPPFGHLLNFFESSNATGMTYSVDTSIPPVSISPTLNNTKQTNAANFFRLFEFVNVPSRMAGSRMPNYSTLYNNAPAPLGYEHPGWPFTAPHNLFSAYREPGRVNINTIIPLHSIVRFNSDNKPYGRTEGTSLANGMAAVVRNERYRDDGASIWRSVLNDFHPAIRWVGNTAADVVDGLGVPLMPRGVGSPQLQTPKTMAHLRQQNTSTASGQTGTRAGFMQGANDVTQSPYIFNPSEDTVGNFYSAFASMFKDDTNSDPRGPDGVYQNFPYWDPLTSTVYNSDDRFLHPFWNGASPPKLSRHDGFRSSMISNPFRSFMEDFSATPKGQPAVFGALADKRFSTFEDLTNNNQRLPLLAVDSTLLRRRDTTWNPWHRNWLPINPTAGEIQAASVGTAPTSKLFGPAQIDPRFDPLFALNYPRPFHHRSQQQGDIFSTNAIVPGTTANVAKPAWWMYSGLSSSLAHYIGSSSVTGAITYGAATVDAIRVKDSDYRNTDRNPFFRYQLYTKLSNTITTRSNVYAIWVTVGYFECERVQPGVIYPVQFGHSNATEFATKHRYPDGYRIIRELGSDNGETQRHRAFAILDRTIPVGFLRGENLNVDRCFLIKRVIE